MLPKSDKIEAHAVEIRDLRKLIVEMHKPDYSSCKPGMNS
jgi:hypothetical protein